MGSDSFDAQPPVLFAAVSRLEMGHLPASLLLFCHATPLFADVPSGAPESGGSCLAWQLAALVLVVLVLFAPQIANRIVALRRLEYGDFKAEFSELLKTLPPEVAKGVEQEAAADHRPPPNQVVSAAWSSIAEALRERYGDKSGTALRRSLRGDGYSVDFIVTLEKLRAVQERLGEEQVDGFEADNYQRVVNQVVRYLKGSSP